MAASSLGSVQTDHSTKNIMPCLGILLEATEQLKALDNVNFSVSERGCDDRLFYLG